MSKKNGRPYLGPQFTRDKHSAGGNVETNQTMNIGMNFGENQGDLMLLLIQVLFGVGISFIAQLYYTYQFGLMQKTLLSLIGMTAANTILFILVYVIGGLIGAGILKSKKNPLGNFLMPLLLVVWIGISYLIFMNI